MLVQLLVTVRVPVELADPEEYFRHSTKLSDIVEIEFVARAFQPFKREQS